MHLPITPTACLCLAVFALLASGPAAARDRLVDGFPDLPRDARAVAERSLGCQHFAGEFTGDGGERDREVNAELKAMRCDRIERDLKAMRAKYCRAPRILQILREAELPSD